MPVRVREKVMNYKRNLIIGATLVLLAAPCLAIAQTVDAQPSATPSTSTAPPPATAESAGVNTGGQVVSATDLPPEQAGALAAGDNRLVTNGPVRDTPQNRAKYGAPISHAGRATSPSGD